MKPVYAENLVVAIKYASCFEWYVLEKDFCIMDGKKLDEAIRKKGYELPPPDNSYRFGIEILDENTQADFLKNIGEYKISADELKEMLINEETFDDKLAYNPSVLIDFENKILKSQYAEPESYENFVPDGWICKYEDFTDDIPENQRYWLDKNNRCLIGE